MSMSLGVRCQSMHVEVRGQSQVTTFIFHLEKGVSCGLQQGLLVVCHSMAQASWPGSYSEYPVCTSSLAVGALRLHTDAATVPTLHGAGD